MTAADRRQLVKIMAGNGLRLLAKPFFYGAYIKRLPAVKKIKNARTYGSGHNYIVNENNY